MLVDQSKGTVLELASEDLPLSVFSSACQRQKTTHTLRVHVRHFLNLERALETRSVYSSALTPLLTPSHLPLTLVSTPHNQQALLARHILGQRLEMRILIEHLFNLTGDIVQTVDNLLTTSRLADRVVRKLNRHHDECNVLRRVRLGRGDTNLGTGIDVDTRVSLAREGRLDVSCVIHLGNGYSTHTDSIDNTQAQSTTLQAVTHGENSIGSLTRLRDKNGDIISEHGRTAVQKVGS